MDEFTFRRAVASDVAAIVELLADDQLGASRESAAGSADDAYGRAFVAVDADPHQFLCVMEAGEEIVGTLQLTFIPGLGRLGAWRGQIEAVRIAAVRRGQRLGEAMIAWAVEECRSRGCALVQLTTDRARTDAHRFYDRLGFEASHIGYKLMLG